MEQIPDNQTFVPYEQKLAEVIAEVIAQIIAERFAEYSDGMLAEIIADKFTEYSDGILAEVIAEVIAQILAEKLSEYPDGMLAEIIAKKLAEYSDGMLAEITHEIHPGEFEGIPAARIAEILADFLGEIPSGRFALSHKKKQALYRKLFRSGKRNPAITITAKLAEILVERINAGQLRAEGSDGRINHEKKPPPGSA